MTAQTDTPTRECFTEGCAAQIPGYAGSYYCDPCVAEQTERQADELRAFDAFHKFADGRFVIDAKARPTTVGYDELRTTD